MTERSFVEVDRLRIRVEVRPGTSPGVPLLVCNGLAAHLEVLQPFVDALDERITVVRFDAPGVGESTVPGLPRSFASLARLTTHLVTQLGHDRFDVLGVSWGGALAQQIALQSPRRCRRVVLAATTAGWIGVPGRPSVMQHLMTPWRYLDPDHARKVAGTVYGGAIREHPELAEPVLYDAERPPSPRGYLFQLLATSGWSSLPVLPAIRQPTLVLAGTDDPIIPLVNARLMVRLLPRGRLHTYDDGHLALLTRPHDLGPVVSDFLLAE